ncbi:MAG: PucR family transcriptional regulator ligand-binding domain-containing protein, partial [Pyramidobacter sp.]|nr:PucR family transcriptional regulator ligand-binding domain-containing protein [Pyramidobacter sp.]
MATTVRETLALDSFKGFSVVAGFEGLDREIVSTTFIEAPDSWKWIRGGEFVITLAYAYQTEEQLYMLVKELIERGATCIGIKTERFIGVIPQSVLNLADTFKFPVIDIPISVPFADIIHPVQSLIIHDQARLLKYSERVRHTFFDLSIKSAEIEEIIQTLREFTHMNLAFIDMTSEKKYFASDSPRLPSDLDKLPLSDILTRYPYESIAVDQKFWGYLVFDVEREKLKDRWSEIPINQAKGALLLYLQRREVQRQVESRYRNEFVQDLITHNIRMEQEAWNRAKTFNWDLTGAQMVVVVDIDNYKSQLTQSIARGAGSAALENAKTRIFSISRSFLAHLDNKRYPYAEMSDSVVYIFPAGKDAAGDRFRDLLKRTL